MHCIQNVLAIQLINLQNDKIPEVYQSQGEEIVCIAFVITKYTF